MNLNETKIYTENETKQLGRDLLRSGSSIRLRLSGNSMFPFLLPDDVAIIDPKPISGLKIGQIIVFENGSKWLAHRLIEIRKNSKKNQLQTQGDSILKADAPFGQKEYLGIIETVFRDGVERNLNGALSQFDARVMLHFRPVPHIVFRIILKVRNKLKSMFRPS